MKLSNRSRPRLPDPALAFAFEGLGGINDLKAGLRLFLSRYHPAAVALFMVQAANYNVLFSRDRSERGIIMTADGSPLVESILIDLYAKMIQNRSTIRTPRAVYTVTMEGVVDIQRVNILLHHNFLLSEAFAKTNEANGERFRLN